MSHLEVVLTRHCVVSRFVVSLKSIGQALVLPIMLLMLCLTMSACKKASVKKNDPKPPAPQTKEVVKDKDQLEPDSIAITQDNACSVLEDNVELAVLDHLTADYQSIGERLDFAFSIWVDQMKVILKDHDNPQTFAFDHYSCSNFFKVMEASYETYKEHMIEHENATSYKWIHMIDDHVYHMLRHTLSTLDYFTKIRSSGTETKLRTTGLSLFQRPDYWWRYPDRFFVDPLIDNNMSKLIPAGSEILAIQDVAFKEITSFSDLQNKVGFQASKPEIAIEYLPFENGSFASETQHQTIQTDGSSYHNEINDYLRFKDIPISDSESIMYIKILMINEKSKDYLESRLQILSYTDHYKGLIIDLRSNVGGSLAYAEKMASLFLPLGSPLAKVIETQRMPASIDLKKGESYTGKTHVSRLIKHVSNDMKSLAQDQLLPMVVLVDRGSASSGEVIPSAWRANQLPMLMVGENTFGKAIGQESVTGADYQMRVTSSAIFSFEMDADENPQWYTWQLDSAKQQRGLVPDIHIPDPVLQSLEKGKAALIKEAEAKDAFVPYFHMEDLKDRSGFPVIEFSEPLAELDAEVELLIDKAFRFDPKEKAAMIKKGNEIAGKLTSCQIETIPGHEDFREEVECHYEAGLEIMKAWIAYRELSPVNS